MDPDPGYAIVCGNPHYSIRLHKRQQIIKGDGYDRGRNGKGLTLQKILYHSNEQLELLPVDQMACIFEVNDLDIGLV